MSKNNDLEPRRFCGEDFQLQEIRVDLKNPGINIIKCKKCGSQAKKKYWQKPKNINGLRFNYMGIDYAEDITKEQFDLLFPVGYIIPYSETKMPFGEWETLVFIQNYIDDKPIETKYKERVS